MKQRSVTVLGMHRSGTSLVAGVLKQLGVDMGEPNPPIIRWDSPLGQIEDLDFIRLDDEILAAAGGSWDKPPSHDNIMAQKDTFSGKIKSLVESKKSPVWGWKTARNCLTVELYVPHLPDPCYIVCQRSANAICSSLAIRNGMSMDTAMRLNNVYDSRLGKFHEKRTPFIVMYEQISAEKVKFVDSLTDFLGLRVNSDMRNRAIESILSHRVVRELSDNMRAMNDIMLNVGCGSAKADGWIGIDIRPLDGVDIVWDLTHFPWPLANNCCSAIHMGQVWEIIPPRFRMKLMDEMWRIAKPDCELAITAPHSTTLGAAQDPTHYGCPNEVTFWYFDPRHPRYHEYDPLPWEVTEQFMASQNVCVRLRPMKGLVK